MMAPVQKVAHITRHFFWSDPYFSPDVPFISELMCGFVPVAPVSTNRFSREEYGSVGVPTLVVVGERDTGLGRTSAKHLSQIPSASRVQVGSDSTASSSHLRTLLPESSSRLLPAKQPNRATY